MIVSDIPNRSSSRWLQTCVLLCAVVAIPLGVDWAAAEEDRATDWNQNWHQWRGPQANGVAPLSNPPVQWDENTNVKWKVEIPGQGASTPIVWDDQVFVLTTVDTGKAGEKSAEDAHPPAARSGHGARERGDGPGVVRSQSLHQFVVLSFERGSGQVRWRKIATEQVPHEGHQGTHGFASASPVTDGRRLFASFGSRGIYCYDLEGNLKWERDLGDMKTRHSYGEGASTALYEETLVVNWDHDGDSFIVALDAETGEPKWKKERNEETTWSTPLIVPGDERVQVIVNGYKRVRSYDLATGEIVWQWSGQLETVLPSPVAANGIVYCMSHTGFQAMLYALPVDSSGDITGADKIVWRYQHRRQWVPSPLLYGDLIYVLNDQRSALSCLDARTGKVHINQERLDSLSAVYASPVGVSDRVYLPSRNGACLVFKRGALLETLAVNQLDDTFSASPAIVGREIFLRGNQYLYCIAEKMEAFEARIRSAGEDGTMTREEAGGRIEAYKKSIGREMRNNQPLRTHRSVMQ